MIVTRFAPSPTGHLHIGGARTALFSWLYARHHKGKFILRIEDTDQERSSVESVRQILESMKWLGIDWDEGPFFQSRRYDIYRKFAEKLTDEGKAYRCYCTPEELQIKRDEAAKKGEKPKYDGKCRNLNGTDTDAPFVIRFKTPQDGETVLEDKVKGTVVFKNSELDDLVILRTDKTPTYNFTVVIDDATMGVTCVIRGDDHLNNTPRQIHMYEALGFSVPEFAHIPLILGTDKTRLSKRHGATSVTAYKDTGYFAEALVNYLARLGWSHGDKEIFSMDELIELFTLEKVGKSAAVFNPDKLLWLNSYYLKTVPLQTILKNIEDKLFLLNNPEDFVIKAFESCREKVKTLKELVEYSLFYFKEEIEIPEDLKNKFLTEEIKKGLTVLIENLQNLDIFSQQEIENAFRKSVESTGITLKEIAQPVRVALTGSTISPGLFLIIEILGKEKTVKRLKSAVSLIN